MVAGDDSIRLPKHRRSSTEEGPPPPRQMVEAIVYLNMILALSLRYLKPAVNAVASTPMSCSLAFFGPFSAL